MAFRTDADGHIRGDNARLEVVFDASSGGIRSLRNLLTGQSMLAEPSGSPVPWRLAPQGAPDTAGFGAALGVLAGGGAGGGFTPGARRSGVRVPSVEPRELRATVDGDTVLLEWTTSDPGVTVRVRAVLPEGGDLELWPSVHVDEKTVPPDRLTYPILQPAALSGEQDRLVFPAHSGWLVRAPLSSAHQATYPNGYAGCSLQAMAYYAEGVGGFYLAAHDPHSTQKLLRFGAGEASFRHDHWDIRRGTGMDLGYPVVIAPLDRGDWYEAAERYRAWALTAPWCVKGPKWGRDDSSYARWLHEEVGISLWGTPSSLDWTPWYEAFARAAGAPMHIVSGWDWPARLPPHVGRDNWFPARFHPANVEAWKGHRVTPYMNDIFVSPRSPGFLTEWEPALVLPYRNFSWHLFAASAGWVNGDGPRPDPAVTVDQPLYLCPASETQADVHTWRDLTLVRDHGLDGIFYDISSGNPPVTCVRAEHGHPPGSGRAIVEAYDRNNGASSDAILAATGRYPAQGTETIIENIVGSVDFYVSRAAAGPVGGLETFFLGPEEPPGTGKELIPFFQAVYHDVGPVHEDGWVNCAVTLGDLFYWVGARITLQWGGILSLHYANHQTERIPGHDGPSRVISWDGALHEWTDLVDADPAKLAFLGELSAARTTFGVPYLGYGRMLRPAGVPTDTVALEYHRPYQPVESRGEWAVPRILESAWMSPDGDVGMFFVNLDGAGPAKAKVEVDVAQRWGVQAQGCPVRVTTRGGSVESGVVSAGGVLALDLELAPRRIMLVEILCADRR